MTRETVMRETATSAETHPGIGASALETLEAPPLVATVQKTFPRPSGIPEEELFYLKLQNPNPHATWDFWLLLIAQHVGDVSIFSEIVPDAGGGYRRLVTTVERTVIEKNRYLLDLEAESTSFGVVVLSRMKSREVYEEMRRRVYLSTTRIEDYDADGELVNRQVVAPEEVDWPDLPAGDPQTAGVGVDYRVSQFDPGRNVDLVGWVHYPTVTASPGGDAGDYTVADGELHAPERGVGTLFAPGAPAQPKGIYVEICHQGGSPSLVSNSYYLVEDDGIPRRLFGDRCTEVSLTSIRELIRKKEKDSWFRKKVELKIVREELRISSVQCQPT